MIIVGVSVVITMGSASLNTTLVQNNHNHVIGLLSMQVNNCYYRPCSQRSVFWHCSLLSGLSDSLMRISALVKKVTVHVHSSTLEQHSSPYVQQHNNHINTDSCNVVDASSSFLMSIESCICSEYVVNTSILWLMRLTNLALCH